MAPSQPAAAAASRAGERRSGARWRPRAVRYLGSIAESLNPALVDDSNMRASILQASVELDICSSGHYDRRVAQEGGFSRPVMYDCDLEVDAVNGMLVLARARRVMLVAALAAMAVPASSAMATTIGRGSSDGVAPPLIAQAFSPKQVPRGGTSRLRLTVSNPSENTVALTGVAFSDTLPSGVVVATPNGLTSDCEGTASATAGGNSISLAAGSIPAESSCTVAVNVTGTTAGTKENTAGPVISTNGGTGNKATATLTVVVVAPPSITMAFDPKQVPANAPSKLEVTISNPSENTVALSGVAFSDVLPSGVLVATPNGLSSDCEGEASAAAGGNSIVLIDGSIPVKSSCTFEVNVTGTTAARHEITVGPVSSANGGTGNKATATLTVVGPPYLAMQFTGPSMERVVGKPIDLDFRVGNRAANTAALTGLAFSDTLPSGLVVAPSTEPRHNDCGGTLSATPGGTSISLRDGFLGRPGLECRVAVYVIASKEGTFTNTTDPVSSTNGGTGNKATATVTIGPPRLGLDDFRHLLADSRSVGPGKTLVRKVKLAKAKYTAGDLAGACRALGGYIREVKRQTCRTITRAQARDLIADARRTGKAIGCANG